MLVTFTHDGMGHRSPEWPTPEVEVEITAAHHTAHGERMAGRNWLLWPEDHRGPVHADTFAEAVFMAACDAADALGGAVLATVAGVPVPSGWDAVALLAESWQADPPFSDWPEILDRAHPDADVDRAVSFAQLGLKIARERHAEAEAYFNAHRDTDRYAADNLLRAANDVTEARRDLNRATKRD